MTLGNTSTKDHKHLSIQGIFVFPGVCKQQCFYYLDTVIRQNTLILKIKLKRTLLAQNTTISYLARPFPGFIMQLSSSHHHGLIDCFSCLLLWELFILFFRWWWSGWGNLTLWQRWFWRSKLISQLRKANILLSAMNESKGEQCCHGKTWYDLNFSSASC